MDERDTTLTSILSLWSVRTLPLAAACRSQVKLNAFAPLRSQGPSGFYQSGFYRGRPLPACPTDRRTDAILVRCHVVCGADQRPCKISPMVRLLHVLLWKRDQTMLLCSSVTSHAPISNLMRRNQSDHNRHCGRGDGYYVRHAKHHLPVRLKIVRDDAGAD